MGEHRSRDISTSSQHPVLKPAGVIPRKKAKTPLKSKVFADSYVSMSLFIDNDVLIALLKGTYEPYADIILRRDDIGHCYPVEVRIRRLVGRRIKR